MSAQVFSKEAKIISSAILGNRFVNLPEKAIYMYHQ